MQDLQNVIPVELISQEESISGNILSSLNLRVLCIRRAQVATEKLYLSLDSSVPTSYMQNEAYLRGKLDLLNELLSDHQAAISSQSPQ